MRWRNTDSSYGLVAIAVHWLSAIVIIALFALGLWMVELNYYDPWYQQAPDLHKSTGMLLFALILARWLWRAANPRPVPIGRSLERRLARGVHVSMYLVLVTTLIAGYLIPTAQGRGIEVFGWFSVPATLSEVPGQEDIAGAIHLWTAWILIGLTIGHTLAALKHHFIDRDATLQRMFTTHPTRNTNQGNKGDQ